MIKSEFYIKVGDQQEIAFTQQFPHTRFLGYTYSPAFTNTMQQDTGVDGSQFNGKTFGSSTLTANFFVHATSPLQMTVMRSSLYGFWGATRDLIRLRVSREMGKCWYATPQTFAINNISETNYDSLFTIVFDVPSGYKYSVVNSNQLMEYGEQWMLYAGNIPNGKDLIYHYKNQTSFKIYNASDIAIDPFTQRHEIKIVMKHIGGQFGLVNDTNGSSWTYKGNMSSSDTLMLDGIETFKNDKTDTVNTDYGYLILDKGWNQISVTGASDLDVTFSFPFIYLG